jgi:prophage regulatory protein
MRSKCAKPKSHARAEIAPKSPTTDTPRRMLRFPALRERVPLSRSTIWRLIQKGEFPAAIRLTGGHAVGWREDLVDAWLRQRCGE